MQAPPPSPPPPPNGWDWRKATGLIAVFLIAGLSGWALERLGAPVPWMIGPMLSTAAILMSIAPRIAVPNRLRPVGQVVVATQVGLAFSPEALDLLRNLAPVIVGAAIVTALSIIAVAFMVARLTRQGTAQAFLSLVPTSPVEAAAMAIRAGIAPTPVIFSQTLRMAAVVLIVPVGLYALDGWPAIERPAVYFSVPDPVHLLSLASIGLVGMILFRVLRVPNPNFLGPMALAALLAVSGNAPLNYPSDILALAQILLGTWLGAIFRREFIASALRLTVVSLASSLVLLIVCALSGVAIAMVAGVDWRILVLGTAPGGVVEMALTAKFLGQSVVLISTFHLVRIFVIMPNIPWIVRLLNRRDARKTGKKPSQ